MFFNDYSGSQNLLLQSCFEKSMFRHFVGFKNFTPNICLCLKARRRQVTYDGRKVLSKRIKDFRTNSKCNSLNTYGMSFYLITISINVTKTLIYFNRKYPNNNYSCLYRMHESGLFFYIKFKYLTFTLSCIYIHRDWRLTYSVT